MHCDIDKFEINLKIHGLKLCAVFFTMKRISVSAHITLFFQYETIYRYQPISHCVFIIRRISVSAHITLCAVFFTMKRISVSAHITLCFQYVTIYRYQPISHYVFFTMKTYIGNSPCCTLCSSFHCETYIGISLYHTSYSGFRHDIRRLSASAHTTLCAVVFTMRRISI